MPHPSSRCLRVVLFFVKRSGSAGCPPSPRVSELLHLLPKLQIYTIDLTPASYHDDCSPGLKIGFEEELSFQPQGRVEALSERADEGIGSDVPKPTAILLTVPVGNTQAMNLPYPPL